MIDTRLIDAALGEADNALEILRRPAPADPVVRRRQMAQAAKRLNKAARILTQWEDLAAEQFA